MKPSTILKIAPTVLWFALIPRNASAQGEPPPAEPPPAAAPAALKPPRFHATPGELTPHSVIEVDFPAPVVPADKINTETGLITTNPAIPGKGIWT